MVLKNNNTSSCSREAGATLVEYALLVGLVIIVTAIGVLVLGQTSSAQFSMVTDPMDGE